MSESMQTIYANFAEEVEHLIDNLTADPSPEARILALTAARSILHGHAGKLKKRVVSLVNDVRGEVIDD